jgi:hypothetical protein
VPNVAGVPVRRVRVPVGMASDQMAPAEWERVSNTPAGRAEDWSETTTRNGRVTANTEGAI